MLPLTEDPWQVFTVDLTINGDPFHAQVEIRYLPAPDQWFLSIWDHASGEMLVNQGSLFCLRNTDEPSTPDPAKGNLTEFQILWGDTFDDRQ